MDDSFSFTLRSAADTEELGAHLAHLISASGALFVDGPLGAGKTTLAQALGKNLGIADVITSPTFAFVNEYPVPNSTRLFVHADLYRTDGDVMTLGLVDYLHDKSAITFVEWSERERDLEKYPHLHITISLDQSESRTISIANHGCDTIYKGLHDVYAIH